MLKDLSFGFPFQKISKVLNQFRSLNQEQNIEMVTNAPAKYADPSSKTLDFPSKVMKILHSTDGIPPSTENHPPYSILSLYRHFVICTDAIP